ncbi:MAG TPA: cobalamin-binding protein [Candidatus Binatia bacterium]|jgi:iron complex transport system substrate-binding protein
MRICSLLPGATEVVYLLGLGDEVVGVTHECDYPAEAKQKPVVVHSAIDPRRMASAEIDRKVGELLQAGKGLYTIDTPVFLEAAPDLILTQGLCDVCALDYAKVLEAAEHLPHQPSILSLNPHSLDEILEDIARIGAATRRESSAAALLGDLRRRIAQVGIREPDYRPRVVCLEWFDPLYVAGHWVPEMVALAGGFDVLGRIGQPSYRVDWHSVVDANPDVILLMPCGFDVRRTVKESAPLGRLQGWNALAAVKAGNVYALNGHAYFSRPGPRLVNGLEILARILHAEDADASWSSNEAAKLN